MVVHDVSVCIVRLIMEAPLGYVHSLQVSPNGAFFPNPLRGQGTRLHLYVLYHSRTSLILKADSGPAGAGSDTSRDSWASVGEVALPSHRFLVLGSAFDKIAGPSRCPPTPAAAPLKSTGPVHRLGEHLWEERVLSSSPSPFFPPLGRVSRNILTHHS